MSLWRSSSQDRTLKPYNPRGQDVPALEVQTVKRPLLGLLISGGPIRYRAGVILSQGHGAACRQGRPAPAYGR